MKIYKTFFQAVNSGVYVVVVGVFFVLAQLASSGSDYFVSQWANWEESVAHRTTPIERTEQNATFEITTAANENVTNASVTVSPRNILNDTDVLTSTLASILISTLDPAVQTASNNSAISDEDAFAIAMKRERFMLTYAIIMVVGTCVYIYRSFSFFRLCLRVSINMHDNLFRGITRARMIFFNNNPSGRILNRFARDISNVDSLLPVVLIDVIDVSAHKIIISCPKNQSENLMENYSFICSSF